MKNITYIIDDKIVQKEQTEQSKKCSHKIINKLINGTRYRYCEKCNMKAHEDGNFSYWCGCQWCKCSC